MSWIHPYFRLLPKVYIAKYPSAGIWARSRVGCAGRSALVLALLLLAAAKLFGQVDAVLLVHGTDAEMRVQNPTPKPLSVSITLYRNAAEKQPPLGDSIQAKISPRSFVLQPGRMQVVRLRLVSLVNKGTTLRLATTFTPMEAPDTRPGLHLVFATRLITRVEVVP